VGWVDTRQVGVEARREGLGDVSTVPECGFGGLCPLGERRLGLGQERLGLVEQPIMGERDAERLAGGEAVQ